MRITTNKSDFQAAQHRHGQDDGPEGGVARLSLRVRMPRPHHQDAEGQQV